MRAHQLAQVRATFVGDPRVDVEALGLPIGVEQLLDAGGPIGVDTAAQSGRPRVVDERAELEVVVGMMVRDEDVAQRRQRQAGLHQLEGDPVARVDHIRHVAVDDQVRARRRRIGGDSRAALGAEQHQPVAADAGLLRAAQRRPQERGSEPEGGADQNFSAPRVHGTRLPTVRCA